MSDDDKRSSRRPDGTFNKGYTANPKGAPKKANHVTSRSPFDILLDERFTATNDDLSLTPREKQQLRVFKSALAGSKRARRRVLEWIEERDKLRIERAMRANRLPVKLLREFDPDNADEALLLLGIVSLDTSDYLPANAEPSERKRLKLEPWAVQAALAHRHGGSRLGGEDITEIERTTRNPETIRWPRGYRR